MVKQFLNLCMICGFLFASPAQADNNSTSFTFNGANDAFNNGQLPAAGLLDGRWLQIAAAELPSAVNNGLDYIGPEAGYYPDGKIVMPNEGGYSLYYLEVRSAADIFGALRSTIQ